MSSDSELIGTNRPPPFAESAGSLDELDSLYAMSIEIASLRKLNQVMDRALDYCLQLTKSEFGFVGLIDDPAFLDVAAIKGFVPDKPEFWEQFRRIPIRRTIFGVVVIEGRPNLSNDVVADDLHVGAPRGHPPVRTFLGVPLTVRDRTIGMIGVANRSDGYHHGHERLMSTFANQVAVAIANARLYEEQQTMIATLQSLHARLDQAEIQAMIDQERTRIAEELHDRVAQIMFGIGITANWCVENFPREDVSHQLERIRGLAARGGEEIRRSVYDLATTQSTSGSLVEEIRETVRAINGAGAVQIDMVVSGKPRRLPQHIEDTLHRVVIEALTNVQRHSRADVAVVSLSYENQRTLLVVQDSGLGIADTTLTTFRFDHGHFGLRGIERRVSEVGGQLDLQNSDEGGFVIRVSIPTAGSRGTG
ncbi:MAG: GAF domain-containing protein [Nitrolancea sp.]